MRGRLTGKVALITGAAQGIGASVARCFAAEGATLILVDINRQGLNTFADELAAEFGRTMLPQTVDISDKPQVDQAVHTAVNAYGKIDVLINNAGVNVFSAPLDVSPELWNKSLAINLEGAWHYCKAILPHMVSAGYGNIVNIASVHGHKVVRGAMPYAVAKHGLVGLTRVLGVEYAANGIRVNSISPGLIETPIADAYFESFDDPDAERARQADILPCKHFGQPNDVANTALFLASDEARFINATDILVDGGRSQVYCD